MPQDLRTRCGKEASHRGQRRCPPLTGRPGRALHPEACPPCPGLRWGARCMAPGAGAGWDPGADTWPHRRPRADSCALGYSRLDQGAASEPFAAGRPQRRAPRGRASAVLSGAQNARGQISRGRSSPIVYQGEWFLDVRRVLLDFSLDGENWVLLGTVCLESSCPPGLLVILRFRFCNSSTIENIHWRTLEHSK